mmetsp:Transcript_39061/g.96139  ORF Transcript_39061/g.96139 Transcript_39061/m.96139 type:complete len:223 (+) Transcript_39061:716-1384(+)
MIQGRLAIGDDSWLMRGGGGRWEGRGDAPHREIPFGEEAAKFEGDAAWELSVAHVDPLLKRREHTHRPADPDDDDALNLGELVGSKANLSPDSSHRRHTNASSAKHNRVVVLRVDGETTVGATNHGLDEGEIKVLGAHAAHVAAPRARAHVLDHNNELVTHRGGGRDGERVKPDGRGEGGGHELGSEGGDRCRLLPLVPPAEGEEDEAARLPVSNVGGPALA